MKILLCLLLIGLIVLSITPHFYFVWKKKDYRTLMIQVGIIGLAIVSGIIAIYDVNIPSLSGLLNTLSPLEK